MRDGVVIVTDADVAPAGIVNVGGKNMPAGRFVAESSKVRLPFSAGRSSVAVRTIFPPARAPVGDAVNVARSGAAGRTTI